MNENNSLFTSSPNQPKVAQPFGSSVVLHADPEHGGLRTAVTALLAVALILSYWIVYAIFRSLPGDLPDYTIFLSCIGAVAISLAVAYVGERVMKQTWHSGRSVTLNEQGIQARNEEGKEQYFTWGDNLSYVFWFFHLRGYPRGGRERRVQNNWVCLACQVQQEERRLTIYTYVPPKKAAAWTADSHKFHEIHPATLYDKSFRNRIGPPVRPDIPAAFLSGKDGKYWLAERRRWTDGYELIPQDFETFVKFIETH
jgi:hypothetical protein